MGVVLSYCYYYPGTSLRHLGGVPTVGISLRLAGVCVLDAVFK